MGLKVLCLTDHSGHSASNSVYSLLRAVLAEDRVDVLDVASRGHDANAPFFRDKSTSRVWAAPVMPDFEFQDSDALYLRDRREVEVDDYDLILIRFPFPVVDGFFEFLQTVADDRKYVNRPSGIVKTSSKSYLFNFTRFCPPMQLCHSVEDVLAFSRVFPVVLKPLMSYGGKGIVKVKDGIVNPATDSIPVEEFLDSGSTEWPILAMKFLTNVDQGDRRTVVSNGKIITSTIRYPAEGQWLCNVAQGGRAEMSELAPEEEEMIEAISPVLLEQGIVVYGMDTLVGDDGKRQLSEINTLSIGGIYPSEIQSKIPYSKMVSEGILDYFTAL